MGVGLERFHRTHEPSRGSAVKHKPTGCSETIFLYRLHMICVCINESPHAVHMHTSCCIIECPHLKNSSVEHRFHPITETAVVQLFCYQSLRTLISKHSCVGFQNTLFASKELTEWEPNHWTSFRYVVVTAPDDTHSGDMLDFSEQSQPNTGQVATRMQCC
jgi:hypothetical protein